MENVCREWRCAEDLNTTVQTKEKINTKEINTFNIIISSDCIYCSKNNKKQNNTVKQGRPNILDKNVPVTLSWPSQVENIQAPSVALKERSGEQITWENGILSTPGAHWPCCTAWKADRGKHDSLPCSSSAKCKAQRMNARCTKRPTVRTQKIGVFLYFYILFLGHNLVTSWNVKSTPLPDFF